MAVSLEGYWKSTYEYGNNLASTHVLYFAFHRIRRQWRAATAVPIKNDDGSRLFASLTPRKNDTFTGAWAERTSAEGHYQGRIFEGIASFVLINSGLTLDGGWLGVNSAGDHTNHGAWVLERQLHIPDDYMPVDLTQIKQLLGQA